MTLSSTTILLGVVATTGGPAGACYVLAPSQSFVGRAEAVDGDTVAFRTLESDAVSNPPAPPGGATVRVRYGDDATRFDVGTDYQVEAWRHVGGSIESHLAKEGTGCGEGLGTRHADGTFIETGTLIPLAWSWPAIAGVVATAVLAAVVTYGRRRRSSHDRLGQDRGQR